MTRAKAQTKAQTEAQEEAVRTPEEVADVLEAPVVQLGQSDIDNQNDKQEQADRDIVNAALEEQATKDAEAAEARRAALEQAEEDAANAKVEKAPKAPKTTRFYLADPLREDRIYKQGSSYPLRFRAGVLAVTSDEDAELVRNAMRGEVYEENFPDDEAAPVCETCGYAPRSFGAFRAHQSMHPANR